MLAGVVTLVASVASIFFNFDIDQGLQQEIVNNIAAIITTVSSILVLYGRKTATTQLGTPPATNSTTEATD